MNSKYLSVLLILLVVLLQQTFIFAQETAFINHFQLSPDGRQIAYSRIDGSLELYSITEQTVVNLRQGGARLTGISWGGSNDQFITSDLQGHINVWDTKTLQSVQTLSTLYTENSTGISANPTMTLVAISIGERPTQIHSLGTGDLVTELISGETFDVQWNPDGRGIVTAGYTLKIWDTSDYSLRLNIEVDDFHKFATWKPDSNELAIITSGFQDTQDEVVIVDGFTGAERLRYSNHTTQIDQIAWSPNGFYIATSSRDGTINIWETATGTTIQKINENYGNSLPLVWLSSSELIYGDPSHPIGIKSVILPSD